METQPSLAAGNCSATQSRAGAPLPGPALTGHHAFDVSLGVHGVLLGEVQDQLLRRLKLLGSHQPPEGLGEYPSKTQRELVSTFWFWRALSWADGPGR